jgi:GntR family transcriptional regulator
MEGAMSSSGSTLRGKTREAAEGALGWDVEPLGRGGKRPLHMQLASALRVRIQAGQPGPGERLPSEEQLSSQYAVSRHVVRQSLQRLVAEGLVTARQGSGYFVNAPRIRRPLPSLASFTKAMADAGAEVRTQVVRQSVVEVDKDLAHRLCEPGEDRVVHIVRVGSIDGELSAILRGWYPMRFAAALLSTDLTDRSIYDLLRDAYDVDPLEASSVLSVEHAGPEESELLGTAEGVALFELESWTSGQDGRTVEVSRASFRADRFEFSIQDRRPSPSEETDSDLG